MRARTFLLIVLSSVPSEYIEVLDKDLLTKLPFTFLSVSVLVLCGSAELSPSVHVLPLPEHPFSH